jgi:drug/metabolite transporter (DMT)-like permease
MSLNLRASLYMALSMAGFAINDSLVKTLGGVLPTTQVMAVRGLILSVLIILLLWQRGLLPRIREAMIPLVALRASMELTATWFFLSALVILPFASVSAILQSLPLVVTLGAALIFRERVGWKRWLAIAVGLAGVLIIIRPGTEGFAPASILVLVSVLFAAARDLSTRALPVALPSLLVSAATAILVTVFGFIMLLINGNWVTMQPRQVAILGLASLFLFVGYQFIVLSMRIGEVAYVVPFRYTNLLWSIALGYLMFAEVPDSYTILGSSIVVAMGLFTLYRELVRSRQLRAVRQV